MARLQALIQQRTLEKGSAPVSSKYVTGISGATEGVPKMHPLKSSLLKGSLLKGSVGSLIAKAAGAVHAVKLHKFALRTPSMKLKMPRIK